MLNGGFFTRAADLERRGQPFATATVVRAERPTSGKPGDRAIITADGTLHGWIGGSCAGPAVKAQALAALRDGQSRLVRLSPDPQPEAGREGVESLAMTCFSGGTMEIFVEPHLPRPSLLIVGTAPVARALARLGQAMGYRVVAVGTGGSEPPLAEAVEVLDGPDAIAAGGAGPRTLVVVASHGEGDEAALERALAARPAYLGLVASRKRAGSIRDYLRSRGVAEEDLTRLRSPAGLDLGARRPEEIALSILAEIVETLNRGEPAGPGAADAGHGAARGEAGAGGPGGEAETAVDPVCGMTVITAAARHRHEHQGISYFFCCEGCRAKFAGEPERYLEAEGES